MPATRCDLPGADLRFAFKRAGIAGNDMVDIMLEYGFASCRKIGNVQGYLFRNLDLYMGAALTAIFT